MLDGAIDISAIDGFVPLPFQQFDVVTYTSHMGEFETTTFDNAPFPGLSMAVGYTATAVTLLPMAIAGDINFDAAVDFGDLSLLAIRFGQTGAMTWLDGDCDNNDTIGFGDLALMAPNFGLSPTSAPIGISAAELRDALYSIPEPAMAPWVVVVLMCLRHRRHRGHLFLQGAIRWQRTGGALVKRVMK